MICETRKVMCACFLVTAFVLMAGQLRAQSVAGTILGTVADPARAVIVGAKVTLKNQETGFTRETQSDGYGNYEFRIVNPGRYSIAAESTGFKKRVASDIVLAPRDTQRVDFSLEVGEITEVVTVSGEAALVNTDSVQIGETRSARLLTEGPQATPPLIARFGSNTAQWSLYVRSGTSAEGNYKAMGSRATMAETSIDGNAVEAAYIGPPSQAVAAVKNVVINASSEFRSPLVIDAVTKQGTNQLHGSYTAFLTHPALNSLQAGPPGAKRGPQKPLVFHNVTVGGPVWIPKLYNGKNRTFFFLSAERRPESTVAYYLTQYIQAANVPTMAMRNGDFSAYLAKVKPGLQLVDPISGSPFPGNIIPRSRWSPAAVKAVDRFYPEPNISQINDSEIPQQNLNVLYDEGGIASQWFWRVDHNFGTKNTVGFSYAARPSAETGLHAPWWNLVPTTGRYMVDRRTHEYAWHDTHVFSPNVVNEFRVGWFNARQILGATEKASLVIDSLGIDLGSDKARRSAFNAIPNIFITGFARIGGVFSQDDVTNNWYHFRDNVSWKKGRHTLKFGYDHRFKHRDTDSAPNSVAGQWSFSGRWTQDPFADFILGLPESTGRFTPRPVVLARYNELGLYAQDDFAVSKSLTLNLGLRFDRISPRIDKAGAFFSFNPVNGNLVIPDQKALDLVHPAFPKNAIPIQLASAAGYPAQLTDPLRSFAPRIGLAWRPFGAPRTAVRVGYGLFAADEGIIFNNFATLQTGGPFALTESFTNSISNGVPLVTLDRPFPAAIGATASTFSISATNPKIKTPYMQQWNATIEQEVLSKWVVRFSYVGAKNTQLWYYRNINKPAPSLTSFTASRFNYRNFSNVNWLDSGGNSSYHSFQIGFDRKFVDGLYVESLFQWQSEIADVSDQGGYAGIENPYDRRRERAKEILDPIDFRANFIYELPFGPGKPLGAGLRKGSFASGLVGGWQIGGFVEYRNGRPFTVTFSGADPSNTNTFGGRATLVSSGCNARAGNGLSSPYLNINCFKVPDPGDFGTLSRNGFRQPSFHDFSTSLYKFFPLRFIRENVKLRFSISAQNAFNNVIRTNVESNISTPASFGRLFGQQTGRSLTGLGSRAVQLQGQIEF
ncbi:MAG: TonB-dependent receptor [Acidobacteriota bacterium]